MKNIKLILILLLVVAGVSCSKNFLDVKPLANPSTDVLFKSEAGINMLLNATYAELRSFNLSGFGWFVAKEVGSDDANPGSNAGDHSVARMRDFQNFSYLPTETDLNSFWSGNYNLIAKANLVIQYAPNVKFTDTADRARYIGEAKFLRALAYFNLVRGWGGVPLITKVVSDPTSAAKVIPRSSVAEVYAFLEKELNEAIGVLPLKSGYPANELGRATKGAAQTLLAQVYLFQQKNSDCLKECMNVINSGEYSLYPKYWMVSNVNNQNGAESIFEVQFQYNLDIANSWQQWQGVRGTGSGWGFFSPSLSLANSYEAGDPRRDYSIYFKGEPWPYSGETNIHWAAGTDPRANEKTMLPRPFPPGFAGHSPLNRVVMRYADVLLMAAECDNELGNTSDALKYLEMVRARAREGKPVLPEITETNMIKLRHIIWNERRHELADEGYRAYDIRRYDKVEPGFAKKLYDALGRTNYSAKDALYPIPQIEMDFDTKGVLQQNPGW